MASARRYEWTTADGRTRSAWRARWVDVDGRGRQKRGFARQGDALAYAQDREAETRHAVELATDAGTTGRTTVTAWGQTWLSGLDVAPGTRQSYAAALRRIDATIGGRPLAALRPSELRTWKAGLTRADGQPLAPSTAQLTAAVLAMLLRAAVHEGLLTRSPMPAQRASVQRVVDPDELLTLEQVRAWSAALPPVAREMPLVAAATGLRQGELLGLRLERVDFLRRTIRVVEQLQDGEWRQPKTAAGVRTVPLPGVAAEALARHLQEQPPVEGEPIFRRSTGARWTRKTFRETWAPALRRAGLPEWAHWHALRDVAASALIRQGVDVRTVMSVLGHASSEETLRTYARLWPDAQDVARRALDELWAASGGHSVATGDSAAL